MEMTPTRRFNHSGPWCMRTIGLILRLLSPAQRGASTTIRGKLVPHHTIATAQARARPTLIEVPPTSFTNSPTTPGRSCCGVILNFAKAPAVTINCATHKGTSTDIWPLVCAVAAMLEWWTQCQGDDLMLRLQ
jgi:hypothetical protein